MRAASRKGLSRETAREICAALALVMAIASMPAGGVVVFPAAGAPCFTVNICHPLQSAFRSQHLNIPGLLKLQPKPQVLINPVDAEKRGISDGEKVWVESPRGRVGVRARVTDDVMTGQVELNVGGGSPIQAEEWRDANANCVTDFENRDPISGFPVYKALLCEVKKRG